MYINRYIFVYSIGITFLQVNNMMNLLRQTNMKKEWRNYLLNKYLVVVVEVFYTVLNIFPFLQISTQCVRVFALWGTDVELSVYWCQEEDWKISRLQRRTIWLWFGNIKLRSWNLQVTWLKFGSEVLIFLLSITVFDDSRRMF